MSVGEAKARMRAEARARLAEMDDRQRQRASEAIARAIIEGEAFADARSVLAYYATPEEVNLGAVCAVATASGRTLCFPRMDWEAGSMEATAVGSLVHDIEIRRHGIPEPAGGRVLAPGEVDLVLVPGLAFDVAGGRLGRGGGFYDRYIARARGEGAVRVLGVAFACQVLEGGARVAREAHDALVDAVITETGVVLSEGCG